MNTVDLDELGEARPLRLPAHQGRALADSGVVRAQRDPHHGDVWLVQAAGKVGVARINDMEVWIRPKVAIDRL